MGSLLQGSCVIPDLRSQVLGEDELVSFRTQHVTIEQECDGLGRTLDRA